VPYIILTVWWSNFCRVGWQDEFSNVLSSGVCHSNVITSQHPCEMNWFIYLAFMAGETPLDKEDKRLDKLN